MRVADKWWMLRHRAALEAAPKPRQVGLVMDGNRRWARAAGHLNPSVGHRYGAEHLEDFLRWSDGWGIEHLMVYVLSADNINKRPSTEVSYLFDLLATTIPDVLTRRSLISSGAPPAEGDITNALMGGPVKDVDLVIRTSGEHRLSGFFPWQCTHAEIFTSTRMWPAFTEADFAKALAFYASKQHRSAAQVT